MAHPNKDIREAIEYALSKGFTLKKSNGHAYGRLFCPDGTRDGCLMSVWSTPKNPTAHARQIKKKVNACTHNGGENND